MGELLFSVSKVEIKAKGSVCRERRRMSRKIR